MRKRPKVGSHLRRQLQLLEVENTRKCERMKIKQITYMVPMTRLDGKEAQIPWTTVVETGDIARVPNDNPDGLYEKDCAPVRE